MGAGLDETSSNSHHPREVPKAALELAEVVANRSKLDVVRVDVCKYGKVVRERFNDKYGFPEKGTSYTRWEKAGLFLSEATLIQSHNFHVIHDGPQHFDYALWPHLQQFYHRAENFPQNPLIA